MINVYNIAFDSETSQLWGVGYMPDQSAGLRIYELNVNSIKFYLLKKFSLDLRDFESI